MGSPLCYHVNTDLDTTMNEEDKVIIELLMKDFGFEGTIEEFLEMSEKFFDEQEIPFEDETFPNN